LFNYLASVIMHNMITTIGTMKGDQVLAVARALLTAAAILVPFFYLASRILPQVLARVARMRNDELLLLVALALGLGAAAVTQAAGLSLALGAFVAWLLINQSDYAHVLLAGLLSLRAAFVSLFFLTA